MWILNYISEVSFLHLPFQVFIMYKLFKTNKKITLQLSDTLKKNAANIFWDWKLVRNFVSVIHT